MQTLFNGFEIIRWIILVCEAINSWFKLSIIDHLLQILVQRRIFGLFIYDIQRARSPIGVKLFLEPIGIRE